MTETKEWQDVYRSGAWIKDTKQKSAREGKCMSVSFEENETRELGGNLHMQVYQLALQSAHARLIKLYLSIGSKEEKENWKDQVIILCDLIAKNMEMLELIAKRRLG
jgi:hypothetical protein